MTALAAAAFQAHEAIWSALADGARRTGHLVSTDHDVARCVASNALAVLNLAGFIVVPDEPEHVLELRDDGWTLQHSLACRLSGALFDCPVNVAVSAHLADTGPPDDLGRFVVTLDAHGEPGLGAAVPS